MLFWILATALAAASVLPIGVSLFRARPDQADRELEIYRDQLAEVERDAGRGLLSADEADRARLEVQRRLLDADRRHQGPTRRAPRPAVWSAVAAVSGVVLFGTIGLYAVIGAPGYPDLPLQHRLQMAEDTRANRPDQITAEAAASRPPPVQPDEEFAALMDRLRDIVAQRPQDIEGARLLARNEASLGDFPAARRAQQQVVDLAGQDATVDELSFLAESMILAAGGVVTSDAAEVLERIMATGSPDGRSIFYTGLGEAQIGRPDRAFRLWRGLLEQSPPDAPWIPPIRARIEEAASRAGIRYQLPPPATELPGPDAADVAATADMSADDRRQMIQGMVTGLSDRLANDGGTASEWARLVRALGVLGQTERAQAIWDEAQQVFANHPTELDRISRAADEAGLSGTNGAPSAEGRNDIPAGSEGGEP